jgi:hypothetical protein
MYPGKLGDAHELPAMIDNEAIHHTPTEAIKGNGKEKKLGYGFCFHLNAY